MKVLDFTWKETEVQTSHKVRASDWIQENDAKSHAIKKND